MIACIHQQGDILMHAYPNQTSSACHDDNGIQIVGHIISVNHHPGMNSLEVMWNPMQETNANLTLIHIHAVYFFFF